MPTSTPASFPLPPTWDPPPSKEFDPFWPHNAHGPWWPALISALHVCLAPHHTFHHGSKPGLELACCLTTDLHVQLEWIYPSLHGQFDEAHSNRGQYGIHLG